MTKIVYSKKMRLKSLDLKNKNNPPSQTAFKKTWPSWHFWEESYKHFANMKKVSLEDIASW